MILRGDANPVVSDREAPLAREGLTEAEVMTAIHEYGVSDLAEVKLAVLEAAGSLSVVPKREPAE